ncbi:DUF1697 domain-containing protein [Gaetbulibacter saemankumensis]|uniref:DUF1697 domain-containing protein n=1 Tax=Gaetbulibacter saemankumensis TaxID=311208 RepID=UPI0004031481|nr:DUF1697 domain-containing protein [Gaetbulibacter saemankumensis]
MIRYTAFLRGINVSGQKKVQMLELRNVLNQLGLKNVTTYIQSGNVVFETLKTDVKKLSITIQNTIESHFGFEIPVLVKTQAEIERIITDCPFSEEQKDSSYYVLFYTKPEEEKLISLSKESYPNETFHITSSCVYLFCEKGYGRAKCTNNFFERKLKIIATTRNHKTMLKLLSLCAEN